MIAPREYVGTIMELAQGRRGEYVDMQYLTEARTTLTYNMPLAEVVTDFFDALKSRVGRSGRAGGGAALAGSFVPFIFSFFHFFVFISRLYRNVELAGGHLPLRRLERGGAGRGRKNAGGGNCEPWQE